MSHRKKRPVWFKCFLASKALIDAIPDENVGRGVKAAFAYFNDQIEPELDPLSNVVFQTLKDGIAETFADYAKRQNAAGGGNDEK